MGRTVFVVGASDMFFYDRFSRLNAVHHDVNRPAQSTTTLRFELKRKGLLRQYSLAAADAPISDILASQQQSRGMGESMDALCCG